MNIVYRVENNRNGEDQRDLQLLEDDTFQGRNFTDYFQIWCTMILLFILAFVGLIVWACVTFSVFRDVVAIAIFVGLFAWMISQDYLNKPKGPP